MIWEIYGMEGLVNTCDVCGDVVLFVDNSRTSQCGHIVRIGGQIAEFPAKCECCGDQIADYGDLEWHGIGNCVDLCPTCEAYVADGDFCATCEGNGWVAAEGKH